MAISNDPTHTEVQNELGSDASTSLRDMLDVAFGSPVGSLRDFAGYTHDTTAPTAPSNLTGVGSFDGSGDFSLDWDASTDNGSGLDYYNIYKDGYLGVYDTTGSNQTSYSGTQNFSGNSTTEDYYVTAVDNAGNESNSSNTVSVTTSDSCLVEGTLIVTADGELKKIEKLQVGDELMSANINGFEDTNNPKKLLRWESSTLNKSDVTTTVKSIKPVTVKSTVSINNGRIQASSPHNQLIKRDGR